jgi:hypothetical protein
MLLYHTWLTFSKSGVISLLFSLWVNVVRSENRGVENCDFRELENRKSAEQRNVNATHTERHRRL